MEATIHVGITVTAKSDPFTMATEDAEQALEGFTRYPKWVEKSKVEKVRNLNCFETVRELLIQGLPTVEVAKQIQILGEMPTFTQETVRVYCEHFRATLPKALMIARMNPMQYVEAKKVVDNTIDSLQVLSLLTEKMLRRIDIAMNREISMGFLMANVEKQFAICMELACRIHEMKKDLGVTNNQAAEAMSKATAISRVDWDKTYSKAGLNEVMANPESRVRVIRFMEDMTGMFGKMTKAQQDRILEASKKVSGKTEGV